MTNAEKLRTMNDGELAAMFIIFRPSDACIDVVI